MVASRKVPMGERDMISTAEQPLLFADTIHGSLACFNNVRELTFGDSGVRVNTVSGRKLGRCTSL